MDQLHLFLPCAAGVEGFLADEVHALTGLAGHDLLTLRGGVLLHASWRTALHLNLHSRLAQRVLVQLAAGTYRREADLYALAFEVAWHNWFTPRQSFKVEVTAQHSPLKSLNFAALRIKDAVADRFRAYSGSRPDVDTHRPDVRLHLHLAHEQATLYIDTSGQPLFKRGWRENTGDAPLKETLAAAMLAASGWQSHMPLYDPCCGSGTIAIEAAQMACHIAPGLQRRFAFEQLLPYQEHVWIDIKKEAENAVQTTANAKNIYIFGSDVSHRMVDFAQHNAARAGVAYCIHLRGGDVLQRMPPCESPGLLLLNPPYGERIAPAGTAGNRASRHARRGREYTWSGNRGTGNTDNDSHGCTPVPEFFTQLATHWKRHYAGWQAWVLTPNAGLPAAMRLKATRRVPLWNGPIECRLLRFDMVQGSARKTKQVQENSEHPSSS